MKTTKNLGLNMPDKDDFVEIDKINENTEKIDEELAKKADASGGDISETVITTTEESADEYPVPAAGDNAKTVLGKVQKFFGDLRNWMTGVCLLGQIVNNCVTDNAKLPLSAAQGKALMDLYNVLNTNRFGMLTPNAAYVTRGTSSYCVIGKICFLRYDIYVNAIAEVNGVALIPNIPKAQWQTLYPANEWDKTTGTKQIMLEVIGTNLICYYCDGGYYAGYLIYPLV